MEKRKNGRPAGQEHRPIRQRAIVITEHGQRILAQLDAGTYRAHPGRPDVVRRAAEDRRVDCESCLGSGLIREEGETSSLDTWRRCMDCRGTGTGGSNG